MRVLANVSVILCLALSVASTHALAQEKPQVPAAEKAPTAKPVRGNYNLSLRDRRAMGLTVSNILEITKELEAEGVIDGDSTRAEKSAAVAAKLQEKSPHAFANAVALDWEQIVSFIEKLMPLIEMLMKLFTAPK